MHTLSRYGCFHLSWSLLFFLSLFFNRSHGYNAEIKARVAERVADFLFLPVNAIGLTEAFRDAGGLDNNLKASDRNAALRFMYTQVSMMGLRVYFGLEDGTFLFYQDNFRQAVYREPGNGGYRIIAGTSNKDTTTNSTPEVRVEPESRELNHRTCVNATTGEPTSCILKEWSYYIECSKTSNGECDESLSPCPDETSQMLYQDCIQSDRNGVCDPANADPDIKWCKSYTKKQLLPNETSTTITATGRDAEDVGTIVQRGFVPYTISCIDEQGQMTQTPGQAVLESFLAEDNNLTESRLGDCLFGDGVTPVQRSESGTFQYCGGNGKICNDTFVGGQISVNYDPRYRGWYEDVKRLQSSVWSKPYPFFPDVAMGITYGVPIYTTEKKKIGENADGEATYVDQQVFAGVLAIDYILEGISQFLQDQYENSENLVAIIEPEAPHYVIGLSTGSDPGRKVLANYEEPDAPWEDCPDSDLLSEHDCTTIRVSVEDLASSDLEMDRVIRRAFLAQQNAGFPQESLVSVKQSDAIGSAAFSSQTLSFKQQNLEWLIMVVSPLEKSMDDTVGESDLLFVTIIVLGVAGFVLCSALAYSFWQRRTERAMIFADWRFTLAFLFGCAALNLSTFTLLGENTDEMCMLRMWSFHLLYAAALSPLFVKVFRMYVLTSGSVNGRRVAITNAQAALYMTPMVAIQVLILVVVSFVDPPRQTESIELSGYLKSLYTVTCEHESMGFFAVQLVYDALLVLVGCGLAYLSRNIDSQFGEARQLIFALYNIAFTGIIIVLILFLVDMSQSSQYALQAIGVFWASLVGSSAFVLPRLIQVKEDRRTSARRSSTIGGGITHVSGFDAAIGSTTSLAVGEDAAP